MFLSFNRGMAERSLIMLQPFQTCSGRHHQTKMCHPLFLIKAYVFLILARARRENRV